MSHFQALIRVREREPLILHSYSNQQPGSQPAASHQQPVARQPATSHRQPGNKQPATSNQQPATSSQAASNAGSSQAQCRQQAAASRQQPGAVQATATLCTQAAARRCEAIRFPDFNWVKKTNCGKYYWCHSIC